DRVDVRGDATARRRAVADLALVVLAPTKERAVRAGDPAGVLAAEGERAPGSAEGHRLRRIAIVGVVEPELSLPVVAPAARRAGRVDQAAVLASERDRA